MSKDYLHGDTSGYGSHIKVLEFIFRYIDEPKLAVELGMGMFSTPFLLDHCKVLVSIEQQEVEWYNRMLLNFKQNTDGGKWHCVFDIKFNYPFYLVDNNKQKYDLAFVDGAAYFRAASVVEFMRIGTPVIILHDSNLSWYGFGTLDQPAKDFGYMDHAFSWDHPHTRLFTTNQKLIDGIQNL